MGDVGNVMQPITELVNLFVSDFTAVGDESTQYAYGKRHA